VIAVDTRPNNKHYLNTASPNNLVLMGPAGSGKGTQAKLLSEKYTIPHISAGVIFREIRKEDTDLGRKVRELIDRGNLVPDNITNEIILRRINEPDCEKGFILDGYPRNTSQAEFLENHKTIKKCILIEVSDKECVRRISARRICSECRADYNIIYLKPKQEGVCDVCGGKLIMRDDDKPEAIMKRLRIYHEITEPLIGFYEKKGILLRINGEQPIQKVFEDIVRGLDSGRPIL